MPNQITFCLWTQEKSFAEHFLANVKSLKRIHHLPFFLPSYLYLSSISYQSITFPIFILYLLTYYIFYILLSILLLGCNNVGEIVMLATWCWWQFLNVDRQHLKLFIDTFHLKHPLPTSKAFFSLLSSYFFLTFLPAILFFSISSLNLSTLSSAILPIF